MTHTNSPSKRDLVQVLNFIKSYIAQKLSPLAQKVDDTPIILSIDESDLDVADEDGNVLARFNDGHIKTKNFDSRNIASKSDLENLEQNMPKGDISVIEGESSTDLDVADEDGRVVLKLKGGHVITKNFNSANVATKKEIEDIKNEMVDGAHPVSINEDANTDLDIADENGQVLASFKNGHIKTKNFDSSKFVNLTYKFV